MNNIKVGDLVIIISNKSIHRCFDKYIGKISVVDDIRRNVVLTPPSTGILDIGYFIEGINDAVFFKEELLKVPKLSKKEVNKILHEAL